MLDIFLHRRRSSRNARTERNEVEPPLLFNLAGDAAIFSSAVPCHGMITGAIVALRGSLAFVVGRQEMLAGAARMNDSSMRSGRG